MNVAGPSTATLAVTQSSDIDYESFCSGCKKPIDSDPVNGGVVVQFGSTLWHTDCFRCAKCNDQLSAEMTLLFLNDGSPVCAKCSYVCNVCKLEIKDEAIMTGEDSYHASCFTCRTCHKRIEELVFAKTSQGIYCMDCHNDRVARSRRRAEQKQSKSRSRRAKDGQDHKEDVVTPKSATYPRISPTSHPGTPNIIMSDHNGPLSPSMRNKPVPQSVPQDVDASFISELGDITDGSYANIPNGHLMHARSFVDSPSEEGHFFNKKQELRSKASVPERMLSDPPRGRSDTLPRARPNGNEPKHSKSYDDGMKPLQTFIPSSNVPSTISSLGGLDIPGKTTKAERRRSINPPPRQPSKGSRGFNGEEKHASDSDHSAYYSPVSPRSSPKLLPDGDATSSAVPTVTNSGRTEFSDKSNGLTTLSSPPPRGESLRTQQNKEAGSLSTSPTNQTSPHELPESARRPSFSLEPASDDEDDSRGRRGKELEDYFVAPIPPPKDDSLSRSSTPHISRPSSPKSSSHDEGGNDRRRDEDNETTPIQTRTQYNIYPPALPPIRLSLHPTDFADLLQSVADSPPRAPLPRETPASASPTARGPPLIISNLYEPSPTSAAEEDDDYQMQPPLSPSALGNERIKASQTVPAIVHDRTGSGGTTTELSRSEDVHISPSVSLAGSSLSAPSARPRRPSVSSSDHRAAAAAITTDRQEKHERKLSPFYSNNAASASVSSLAPGGSSPRPALPRSDSTDLASRRLREAIQDAKSRGATLLKLDPQFAEAILVSMDKNRETFIGVKNELDSLKRTSQRYVNGLNVAQEEYEKEVLTRKDLQAEVTRLRVQLAGQAARIASITAEERTKTLLEKYAVELTNKMEHLEREVGKVYVERDMALAEIEELASIKKNGGTGGGDAIANVSRALSSRLDYTKSQYRRELEPLQEKREHLSREIAELREARNIFIEETSALNSRNEQLAELNYQIAVQIQMAVTDATASIPSVSQLAHEAAVLSGPSESASQIKHSPPPPTVLPRSLKADNSARGRYSPSLASSTTTPTLTANTSHESTDELGVKQITKQQQPQQKGDTQEHAPQKKFKWFGPGGAKGSAPLDRVSSPSIEKSTPADKGRGHHLTSTNLLRISRCDACGDKLWGPALRCTGCNLVCHVRCESSIKGVCKHTTNNSDESPVDQASLPPSMFGRDLIEQVHADARGGLRTVPVIVEKCIAAVEAVGIEYEGIYRKTGGASESKGITHMFDLGQYDSIDLLDGESFHDISSVTSVLKNYFRALPNPLLTYDQHESFVNSASLRDANDKIAVLRTLAEALPVEHYSTLRDLMLHLHRIRVRSDINLMNARNLGVVFGPTLMRSRDPGQEFADMAGKAQTIEWLVDHATTIFPSTPPEAPEPPSK